MSTIQVRNVPEEVSRSLKAKAAVEGRPLSDFLLSELEKISTRPSRAELIKRIAERVERVLPPAEEILQRERPTQ